MWDLQVGFLGGSASACSQITSMYGIPPHLSEVIKRSPENGWYGRLRKSCREHNRERCEDAVKPQTTASHDYFLLTVAEDCCVLLLALSSLCGDGRDGDVCWWGSLRWCCLSDFGFMTASVDGRATSTRRWYAVCQWYQLSTDVLMTAHSFLWLCFTICQQKHQH
jgi:hypothetical protein